MTDDLLVTRADGVVALTLNRPHRFNAVTVELIDAATAAVEIAGADPAVRLITISGAGRAFCSGADLDDSVEPSSSADGLPPIALVDAVNRLTLAMRAARPLVVALVDGVAAGVGTSFVLGADLAVASDAASLKTSFSGIGLMPDGGGTAFLTAALGRNRALSVAVLDDVITADEALRAGVFARVWPAAEFADRAAEFVRRLADGPTAAYAATKRGIDACAIPELPAALERERTAQRTLLGSTDFSAAVSAFRTKTRPRFTGA